MTTCSKVGESHIILYSTTEVTLPTGSAHDKHKLMGCYWNPLVTLEVGSKRPCIQTAGLAFQKDVDDFGLDICFEETMSELKVLVEEGFFDEKTQTTLSVRIICSLGDNLEQNDIAGISLFIYFFIQTNSYLQSYSAPNCRYAFKLLYNGVLM